LSFRLSAYVIESNRIVRFTRWMTWRGNDFDAGKLSLTKLPKGRSHFLVKDEGHMANRNRSRKAVLNADSESLIDLSGFDLQIIPNGSGFVGKTTSVATEWESSLKSKKKLNAPAIEALCRESVWIVDLEGVRHRLTWDGSALGRAVALYGEELRKAEASPEPEEVVDGRFLSDDRSEWQGDGAGGQPGSAKMNLLLGHAHGATRIDIRRRTVTDVPGRTVAECAAALPWSPSLDSGPSVVLIKLKDIEYRAKILEKREKPSVDYVVSLEARWPTEGKAKTLLSRVVIKGFSMFTKASPNRLFAVLKYEDADKDDDAAGTRVHFLIVDNEGNIVDRLFFHHFDNSMLDEFEAAPAGVPDELQ
jgi:hypothetical protein